MIEQLLAEIEARAKAPTPGPWTVSIEECEDHGCQCGEIHIPEIERAFHSCEWADSEDWDRDEANAEFCAAARTDIPRLVAALRVALAGLEHCDFCADDMGAGLGEEYTKKAEAALKGD